MLHEKITGAFTRALESTVERSTLYEQGSDQLTYLFRLSLDYTFFAGTDTESVNELFVTKIESRDDNLQLLDILHSLITQFAFNLSLQELTLDSVVSLVALAISSPAPRTSEPSLSVLPDHYLSAISDASVAKSVLHNNRWFLALALLRFLVTELMVDPPPTPARPKR